MFEFFCLVVMNFFMNIREKKKQIFKLVGDAATFGAVKLLGIVVRAMNRRQARSLACIFGDFAHKVAGLRSELVYRNLGITFPEKSAAEIRTIATEVYRNIAVTLIDVLRFPLIHSCQDVISLIDMDLSVYLRGTDNGQKGAVVVSGHYGNWELMAMAFGVLFKPLTIIVKQLSNTLIDTSMNKLRMLHGNRIVYDDQALREGLRSLADGGVLAILADQSDPSATYFGKFLGRPATLFHGPAFFSLRAKVPLFVSMCRRASNGRYIVDVHEIDTSDLTFCKADIAILASRYTRVLEEYIRCWPEEWFWLHNRWKNGGTA